MDGKVRDTRRADTVRAPELAHALEPLAPPPLFAITGPLSEVVDPAAKAILTCLIQSLVETGRAEDATT